MNGYTTNSTQYTDHHNEIMDSLLYALSQQDPEAIYTDGRGNYFPLETWGQTILDYLYSNDMIDKLVIVNHKNIT